MKSISSIRLEITSKCNLQCEYCHNSDYNNKSDDMTTEEIKKLVTNLKKRYDINKVLLTGGEPLTNKDVPEIIKFISSLGIKVDMVTNGTLLTEEMIQKLDEAGLKRIRISIDEIGDISASRSMENPNSLWDIAKRVMEKSDNIEVCIHTVCTPNNAKNLFNLYKKVLEIGAKRWRVFDIGFQGGIAKSKEKFDFSTYYTDLINSTREILEHYIANHIEDRLDIEVNNIFRTANLSQKYDANNPVDIEGTINAKCSLSPCDYVADHQLTIRSNGEATLCQYFRNTILDFKKYGYDVDAVMLNKNNVTECQIRVKDLTDCKNCKYLLVCNTGCRSRAHFLTGDITDADPSACFVYPMIKTQIIPILPEEFQKLYNSYLNLKGSEPKYSKKDLQEFLERKGY